MAPDPLQEELAKLRTANTRKDRLFVEMTRRLTLATAVVEAARVHVATGRDRAGLGTLQRALEEFDK